ncbi:MAG: PilZ domain-containing protein [Deltaproteobacteria bacterium]|nr:PilZ domain-containing protein [Deltaproteobacteria bacterium]
MPRRIITSPKKNPEIKTCRNFFRLPLREDSGVELVVRGKHFNLTDLSATGAGFIYRNDQDFRFILNALVKAYLKIRIGQKTSKSFIINATVAWIGDDKPGYKRVGLEFKHDNSDTRIELASLIASLDQECSPE